MQRNIELLRKVRDQILMEPDTHYQADWGQVKRDPAWNFTRRHYERRYVPVSCTTNACVGGWACMLSGDQFVVYEHRYRDNGIFPVDTVRTKSGSFCEILARAGRLLGLASHEAGYVFGGSWTTEQTLENLDHLIKGHALVSGEDMDEWFWRDGS